MSGPAYAITLTKICPGEPTGQISDLLEDWGFPSAEDAIRRFEDIPLTPEYIRKELWTKDPVTKIRKLIREERYGSYDK